MKHDFSMKRREERKIPPEKLYVILRGIYPKKIADEKYTELTGLTPPNIYDQFEFIELEK